MNSICNPPEIIPDVLHPSAGEKLRRLEPARSSLRESQFKSALREFELFVLRQSPLLHVLNLRGQTFEPFSHLKCADHDLLHYIASMTHALGRKGGSRDDQAIRTDDPKDADAQLIG